MNRPPVLNIQPVLLRLGDDMELFAMLLDAFRMDAPKKLHRISGHMADGNYTDVRIEAHALKGAAATVGAERIVILAGELEDLMQQLAALPSSEMTDAITASIATSAMLQQQLTSELEDLYEAVNKLHLISSDPKPD
jgi:HPt (histidine-containing phosphotransfer) domain-containing protein